MALNKKKKIIIIIVCIILIIGSILLSVFLINEKNKIDDLNKNSARYSIGVGIREDKGYTIDFNKFEKLTSNDFNIEVGEGLFYSNGKVYGDKNYIGEVSKCYVKYKKYIILDIEVNILEVEKVIYTYADFLSISNKNDANYILGKDIDLKNVNISLEIFKGYFYANNFKFINFNFNSIKSLFGKTQNAYLEGVKIENVFGKRTADKVGIISDESFSSKFIRCEVSGEIEVKATDSAYIGALVGKYDENNRFLNDQILDYFYRCTSRLNIKIEAVCEDLYVGGIVGYSENGSLLNCYNYGNLDVTTNGLNDLKVGGITGGVNKIYSVYEHRIDSLDTGRGLYNYGKINLIAKNNKNEVFVGGLFGEVINHNIDDSENLAAIDINVENSKLVGGGIVGFTKVTILEMKLKNLLNNSDFTIVGNGEIYAGGICGINIGAVIETSNRGKLPICNISGAVIAEILAKNETIIS